MSEEEAASAGRLRRGGVIRTVWRIAGDERRKLGAAIGLRFAQAICEAIPVAILVWVIDEVRVGDLTGTDAWRALGLYLLCVIGQYGFGYFANRASWAGTYEMTGQLREKALRHLRDLPLGFLTSRRSGDTVTAMTTDVGMVEMFVHAPLPTMLGAIWAPILVFVALCTVDVPMALVTMVAVAVSGPVFVWSNRRFKALAATRQGVQATANARMTEYIQGIAVIRAFGVQGERMTRFRESLDEFRGVNTAMTLRLLPLMIAFTTTVMLGIPLVIFVGGQWLLGATIDAGTFLVFLVLCLRVFQPLVAASESVEALRIADASLDRFAALMDEPVQPEPTMGVAPTDHAIEFDHVSFSYDADVQVLSDVSFHAPEGSLTAIVGPSGSGKTTILNLIARFYDPDSGAVRIGGVALADMTTHTLYDLVTVVFQDVYLFQGTVFDNIAFGRPDATREEVIAAARVAQAHDFVAALPGGYDTFVGEGGATLSGGERQRISIARAVLKDAPIVLLDEATASIDPTNERLVQEALAGLSADKTVVVVAHRLSTIRAADQILVVDDGRILERGDHDELVARDGLYAHLWQQREAAMQWRIGSTPGA